MDAILSVYERAFGIIANASGGDWNKESKEWQEAAYNFRTDYHRLLNRREIFEQITEERSRQDKKWGGPRHDDCHTLADWWAYRSDKEGDIIVRPSDFKDRARIRKKLVQIAALTVAQIEQLDRNPDAFGCRGD